MSATKTRLAPTEIPPDTCTGHDHRGDNDGLHAVYCPRCRCAFPPTEVTLSSSHHTLRGPIAYRRCPRGHHFVGLLATEPRHRPNSR